MRGERGFTLIELLTVIALIGVLASLAISGFSLYRASAAYAVSAQTLRFARNALESSLADPSDLPPAVPMDSQHSQGSIKDPNAAKLLLGMQVPKDVRLVYGYDPGCTSGECEYESFLQVNHCKGREFTRWMRFGDGVEVTLEHLNGDGCPPPAGGAGW